MTKKEAVTLFKETVMPAILKKEEEQGYMAAVKDVPMRSEAWNNFTDMLCKDGEITLKQYESWTHPSICL